MTLEEKKDELLARLSRIKDPQERFAYVVDLGKRHRPLSPEHKTESHRVHGCLAKLWFTADFREGKCFFQIDGDSLIVRAIASILCDFYSARTPREILLIEPVFLAEVGITQHLSPNRRNALSRVWDLIRDFALKNQRSPEPAGGRDETPGVIFLSVFIVCALGAGCSRSKPVRTSRSTIPRISSRSIVSSLTCAENLWTGSRSRSPRISIVCSGK